MFRFCVLIYQDVNVGMTDLLIVSDFQSRETFVFITFASCLRFSLNYVNVRIQF